MNDDSTKRVKGFFGDAGEQALAPRETIGRYALVRELGRGGMAIVYEAVDTTLGRSVAIKLLRDGSIERLRREATAVARLHHPNVVAIYEIGDDFIAMELVQGETFGAAWQTMEKSVRIETVLTVAGAVAAAHAQGVVHRDLKPNNILIEKGGRVVLTDFGLAKATGDIDLTVSGAALGTTHYMAPEQVRGDRQQIGAASDVWALGVMLYECVVGMKPFDGASIPAIYDCIVRQEPPRVPGPLGAVIAKGLEKAPQNRYPDAQAFATDLQHAVTGVPVSAPNAGVLRRWRRILRQRPALLWTAALFGIGLASTVAIMTVSAQRYRAKLLSGLREKARVSLDAALELRRAGALTRMRQFLPPLEAAYREVVEHAPDLPEVDYLLGRMHRALLEDDRALQHQGQALRKDPQFVPSLYERAVLLSLRQGRMFDAAMGDRQNSGAMIANQQSLEGERPELLASRQQAESAWRDYLKVHRMPVPSDVTSLVAEGFVAHYRGDDSQSRLSIEAALRIDPLLEEGWEALSQIIRADRLNTVVERERVWRETEDLLTARIAGDRGYVPHLLARGRMRWLRGSQRRHRGLDALPDYDNASGDFSAVLALDPRSVQALSWRGQINTYRAIARIENAQTPLREISQALDDLTKATDLAPENAMAWMWRGNAHFYRAIYLATQAQDPEQDFLAGVADLSESLQRDEKLVDGYKWRGRLLAQYGAAIGRRGNDPSTVFSRADQDFQIYTKSQKDDSWAWAWWSTVGVERGLWRQTNKQDPSADFEAALQWADKAVALDRNGMEAWKHRGLARYARAVSLDTPTQTAAARTGYAAAVTDFLQALSLNPTLKFQIGERLATAQRRIAELQ